MWVRIEGAHFTNHLCIGDFLLPIHRYFSVSINFKCVRPSDALVVWTISTFALPLAQSAQFIG